MDSLTTSVISAYSITSSLMETARQCAVSAQKVRKILLSNGIMPNSQHTKIINVLTESGIDSADIAAKLHISIKAVEAHLPYQKGMYNRETPTENALRIRKHRAGS